MIRISVANRTRIALLCSVSALLLSGCATTPAATGVMPATVTATAEARPVGTANADAADDPAIWRNVANPAASLIVATDKQAGLYVYALDGSIRSFRDAGRVNNVDLVDMGPAGVIVVASDRNNLIRARLQFFRLDTATGTLVPLGSVDGGAGEGYGLCLGRNGDAVLAYSVLKDGSVSEIRVVPSAMDSAIRLRTFMVPTQAEGCVVDRRDGTLYLAEEDVGIWRLRRGASAPEWVLRTGNGYLVADVEGLAITAEGSEAGYLVASSQGDSTYAMFRLPGLEPVGRFRIGPGTLGGTSLTDGIDLAVGDFGSGFPGGLFVAQDGDNAPAAQNFKLVPWGTVLTALGGASQ